MPGSRYLIQSSDGHRTVQGGRDLQSLRTNNLWALLSAIWDHGPISRFDLAQLTGLAPSSVTRLIRDLAELELIVEIGKGQSSGGRQPILIVPNPQAGLVVSLDLSGPHLLGGVFDAANNLIKMAEQPFNGLGPEAIRKQIVDIIHGLLGVPAARKRSLLGIGVSLPGVIDIRTGEVRDSAILHLQNYPLRKILTAEFGLPVYVEHDASVAALAEHNYGAGRGLESFIYILVSTGIGSGIFLNGEIFRGELGGAGEFGHIILDPGGQLCLCGKRGCLEAMAAAPAILSSARRMMLRERADLLATLSEGHSDRLSIDMIARAAQMGDPLSQEILTNSADYLARGMTIYTNLFDMHHMILGGEVAEMGEVFLAPLRHSLEKYCRAGLDIKVIPAELKRDSFLRGISKLTLQEVLLLQVQQIAEKPDS